MATTPICRVTRGDDGFGPTLGRGAEVEQHDPNGQRALPNARAPAALAQSQAVELVHRLSVLSVNEQKELAEVEKGWQTFLEVGRALTPLRDGRLSRADQDTFPADCREKWQYAKSHTYRLIAAAEAFTTLSPIGEAPGPGNESQMRSLIGMYSEKARLAWRKAVEMAEGAIVTANVKEPVTEQVGSVLQNPVKTNLVEGSWAAKAGKGFRRPSTNLRTFRSATIVNLIDLFVDPH